MFHRLSQLSRHLFPPSSLSSPALVRGGATSLRSAPLSTRMANDRSKNKIHTAACLVIGDEVLGGKVCASLARTDGFSAEGDRMAQGLQAPSLDC